MEESGKQRFLELLNNREKKSTESLFFLLQGTVDGEPLTELGPAQEWCFAQEQESSSFFTARYRANGQGALVEPLVRQFVQDVAAAQSGSSKGASAEITGVIRKSDVNEWIRFEEELARFHHDFDLPADELLPEFASKLRSLLTTDQRLVLFCEVEGTPSLETLGLAGDDLKRRLEVLPEGFALVVAGPEDPSGSEIPDERLERIDAGDDYLEKTPPRDRSQPLASDRAEGDDKLDLTGEVNALADAIASLEMDPPLVLGILGGWGSGKSYVMHLIEKRLLAIRAKDIRDRAVRASFPYVGHIYPVWFNAWTYAKDDLWSSLMQRLLLALNDQIAFEQYKLDKGRESAGCSDGQAALEWVFETPLSGADDFTPRVIERLSGDPDEARRMLDSLDNEILWKRLQGLRKPLLDELKKEEQELRKRKRTLAEERAKIAAEIEVELRRQRWDHYAKKLAGNLVARLTKRIRENREAHPEKTLPFEAAIESIGLLDRVRGGWTLRTSALLALFIVSGLVVAKFGEQLTALWGVLAGGLGGVVGGVVEAWSRANRALAAHVEAFNAFDSRVRASDEERREALLAARMADQQRDNEEEIAQQEAKVEAYRRKIGLTAGHTTLLEFIADRLEKGGYEERLGLLHQVEEDIGFLTRALLSDQLTAPRGEPRSDTKIDELLFPRGRPRVVLFIDDLDRCPPPRVVEVFEAVQLLVNTQLFVVVLAMDVRYITKALEKAYPGVLDRRGAPSGLDYIEKIVQLPYRIRPISKEAMPTYLESQMQLEAPEETEAEDAGAGAGDSESVFSAISAPAEQTVRIDESVPASVLVFGEDERDLIRDCSLAVGAGPRATKRLVNVMKMIKIIWYRTNADVEPDVRKTVVLLLALSAGYAGIMRYVLLEVEAIVAGRKSRGLRQKLSTLLPRIARQSGEVEGRRADSSSLTRIAKNAALLPPEMTLEKLGPHNLDLIRSFSFVGEVDLPHDPDTHQVALQLKSPVEISSKP